MTEEQENKIIQVLSELSKNTATLQKNVNLLVNLKIVELACSQSGNQYKMDKALKTAFKLNGEHREGQIILDSFEDECPEIIVPREEGDDDDDDY